MVALPDNIENFAETNIAPEVQEAFEALRKKGMEPVLVKGECGSWSGGISSKHRRFHSGEVDSSHAVAIFGYSGKPGEAARLVSSIPEHNFETPICDIYVYNLEERRVFFEGRFIS